MHIFLFIGCDKGFRLYFSRFPWSDMVFELNCFDLLPSDHVALGMALYFFRLLLWERGMWSDHCYFQLAVNANLLWMLLSF